MRNPLQICPLWLAACPCESYPWWCASLQLNGVNIPDFRVHWPITSLPTPLNPGAIPTTKIMSPTSNLRCCCLFSKFALAKNHQMMIPRPAFTIVNPNVLPNSSIILADRRCFSSYPKYSIPIHVARPSITCPDTERNTTGYAKTALFLFSSKNVFSSETRSW